MQPTIQMERQYPLVAMFEITKDLFGTGTTITVGHLPGGAVIKSGFVEVVEGFDTSALSFSAGTALTVANVTAGATGRTNGTSPGVAASTTDVTVTRSATTDATGKAYLAIEYIIPNRQHEVQP